MYIYVTAIIGVIKSLVMSRDLTLFRCHPCCGALTKSNCGTAQIVNFTKDLNFPVTQVCQLEELNVHGETLRGEE